jgi:carotenoid cleavage dioxygenase-like enzyme
MTTTRRRFLQTSLASVLALSPSDAAPMQPVKLSPFLQGNFAPVREETTSDDLRIVGKLPDGLEGMFVRNGPNPQFAPRGAYHWFDGDGMLHGVRFQGGKASYRNRYVRTAGYDEEKKAGKSLYDGLMGLPDFLKIAQGEPGYKNAANTALVWYNGQLLALWEGGPPHAIKLPDLSTVGVQNFGGQLKHAFTAHPKIDAATGEMAFFGYGQSRPYIRYSLLDKAGKLLHTTGIDVPNPIMMHDFAVTQKYALFLDLPETFSFDGVLQGKSLLKFDPTLGARVGILAKQAPGKEIRWFEVKTCFVFHTLNAWEEGDEVVLIACRMKEFPDTLDTKPQGMARDSQAVLYRWSFNLKTGAVKEGPLHDVPGDFPRGDDALLGRPMRYGYVMKLAMDGFVKYDLVKGTQVEHRHGKDRLGGEGVFVARPGAKVEDDGWLLTFVHDEANNKSELVVLAANDFGAPPLARVLLPSRVPYGFHGAWVGAALLK